MILYEAEDLGEQGLFWLVCRLRWLVLIFSVLSLAASVCLMAYGLPKRSATDARGWVAPRRWCYPVL